MGAGRKEGKKRGGGGSPEGVEAGASCDLGLTEAMTGLRQECALACDNDVSTSTSTSTSTTPGSTSGSVPQRRKHRSFKDVSVTTGNLWAQVMLYVLPLMGGSLFQQLYTSIDAFILGQYVSSLALGAVDSTFSVVRLLVNLFMGLSTGATIVVAQLWGAHRDREVGTAVHTAVAFALAAGALLTVVGVLVSPALLRLLDTPPENWDYAVTFIRIYFCGLVPLLLYNMCAAILRAVGDSRRPFFFLVVSVLVNIMLDLLFVPILGWGVAGTALATVLAEVVAAILTVATLMRESHAYRLVLRKIGFHRGMLRRMVLLGLPTGIQSALYPVSNAVVQWGINGLGAQAVTGWALTGKIDMFLWLVLDAFGIAVTTFVAQNMGAGFNARARKSIFVCIALGLAMLLPLSALMYFFGGDAARLFTPDVAALTEARTLLMFLAPFYWTFIMVEVLSGAIRGTGETVKPMIITLVGTCLLRIAWIWFVVPLDWNIITVAAVYPVSWIATGLVFIGYFRFGKWRHHIYAPDRAGEGAKAQAAVEAQTA